MLKTNSLLSANERELGPKIAKRQPSREIELEIATPQASSTAHYGGARLTITGLPHRSAPPGPVDFFASFPWVPPTATHGVPLRGNSPCLSVASWRVSFPWVPSRRRGTTHGLPLRDNSPMSRRGMPECGLAMLHLGKSDGTAGRHAPLRQSFKLRHFTGKTLPTPVGPSRQNLTSLHRAPAMPFA